MIRYLWVRVWFQEYSIISVGDEEKEFYLQHMDHDVGVGVEARVNICCCGIMIMMRMCIRMMTMFDVVRMMS